MSLYKTELHCHSRDGSGCADETAEAIVEKYLAAGYATVCMTNHFTPTWPAADTWEEQVEKTYSAYELLKQAAGGRLHILMGMELRFTQNFNDYLVFGFDKEFLLAHPGLTELGIRRFTELARENNILTIHAHPFRSGMVVTKPAYVDGVEVFNGHPGHESNNDIALAWAQKYGKLMTSGTDHHNTDHLPRGGILTAEPITTTVELVRTLKSGRFQLIRDDE